MRHPLSPWSLFVLVGWGLTGPAQAEIRLFNPTTGQTTAISSTQGLSLQPASSMPRPLLPPAPVVTPAAPARPTAMPQVLKPRVSHPTEVTGQPAPTAIGPLGSAMVLIPAVGLTVPMAATVKKITQIPQLTTLLYFHHVDPKTLITIPQASLAQLENLSFETDTDQVRAKALGVPPGQPTIVYRDPTGAVRLYKLVSEYAMFLSRLDHFRLQKGSH